jgi:hypothetical protein
VSGDPLLVRGLLRCYPSRWRHRYGDEYVALLCDVVAAEPWWRCPNLIVNVLRGALDARVHPFGGAVMTSRSPLTVAIWATGLFTVAGIGFQKLSEDAVSTTVTGHPSIGWSFVLMLIFATIALAAIVTAAAPAAVAIVRGRWRGTWKLLTVPPIALAAWYGVLQVARTIASGQTVHSGPTVFAAILLIASGIGVVAATAWAAAATLRRVEVDGESQRLHTTTTYVLPAGMAATTLACLIWGLSVWSANPSDFGARAGILAGPFIPTWLTILALMGAATALAATASRTRPDAAAHA